MTPDERMFLQASGNLIASYLSQMAICVLFFGLTVGVWLLAVRSLLNRGLGRSSRKVQFAALVATLLAAAGPPAIIICTIGVLIRGACIDLKSGLAINLELAPYLIVQDWTEQISLLLNDAVVIWRIWVVYSNKRKLIFVYLTFCGTIATSFAFLGLSSSVSATLGGSTAKESSTGASLEANIVDNLNIASNALSAATNLSATILILLKLWEHCRFMARKKLFTTTSQRILLCLVESGLIFCVSQVVNFVLSTYLTLAGIIPTARYIVVMAVNQIFWASVPMFFPAVILLVQNDCTISEIFHINFNLSKDLADVETAPKPLLVSPATSSEGST